MIWREREILDEGGYDGAVSSERTFYRLFGTLSHGRQVTTSGGAPPITRRAPRRHVRVAACGGAGRGGAIDSTPLEVLVLLDDGAAGGVELTRHDRPRYQGGARCGAAAYDTVGGASVLLAGALTPEPVRSGWPEAPKMAHSASSDWVSSLTSRTWRSDVARASKHGWGRAGRRFLTKLEAGRITGRRRRNGQWRILRRAAGQVHPVAGRMLACDDPAPRNSVR